MPTINDFIDRYGIRTPRLLVERAIERAAKGLDQGEEVPLIKEVMEMMQNLEDALYDLRRPD
jgi:hypothetical protein